MELKKLTNFITATGLMLLLVFTGISFGQSHLAVPGTYTTIQAAATVAASGDFIDVAAGTYTENITLGFGVTLQSTAGADSTTIVGSITIAADNVVIDGFTIQNPSGKHAISATNHNHITIKNNIITDIGGTTSGSNVGIVIVGSTSAVADITIENNTISNIQGGSNNSASGISVGWSAGALTVTNLVIQNNTISNITSGAHGAYGMLLNHGASGGGTIVSPQILNNTISNLEGLWAHGIGLEGNTPNAFVQGNVIHDLIDHKSPSDAVAFQIEDNTGAGSLTISQNSVYNVNWGVQNTTNDVVNAAYNYWNDPTGPTVTSNPSGNGVGVNNTGGGAVIYSPWWSDSVHTTLAGLPNLIAPSNGLTGIAIQPTFSWSATAANYTLKISTHSDMSDSTVYSGISDTTFTLNENQRLINNTTYYWQVTDNNSNSSVIYQFTTNAITITPAFPVGGTVYTTSTMFTWSIGQAVGTMKFKPQIVAKTSSPSPAEWAAATLTATTSNLYYTFSLNGGTQYYWRIVLLNSSNEVMGYSSVKTFTTSGGASVTVTPSYPIGGATVYANPPTLYWYVNQYAPGVTYVVRYSTTNSVDGNGALSSSPDSLIATSNLYKAFSSALLSGTTYWWQVSARYGTSVGTWTTPTSFKTNGGGTPIAPTASYPTGGVTVYTIAPTLYWYLNGNSTGLTYNIQTKKDAGSWTTTASNVSTFYYALSGLTPGSTYQWKVQSDNNGSTSGGESAWSTPETFIVSGGVTSSSTVATWPVGNPTEYTQTPTLSWYLNGSSVGVTGYKVKYSTTDQGSSWGAFNPTSNDSSGGAVTISGVTTTTWTSTVNLTYGQQYYWAVASWDGSSAGTYSTGSFTIAGGSSTGTVVLSYPVGGVTIATKSPTMSWYYTGSTLGITGYKVEYSSTGGAPWSSATTSSTITSVALSGLTAGATYTWKVSPSWDGGTTYPSYSTATTFVVDPGATTIVPIVGGPNNVTINTPEADVSWILPTAPQGNLTYELVFADNKAMANAQKITTTDPYAEVSSLQANKNYYWKVRSVADNGSYSSYSNMGTFKTDDQITAVGGDKEITPTEFKLSQNYPNPFNPSTIIEYSLPEASYVSMKIYNVLGKEIRTLVNGTQNAGNYQTQWNGLDNSGNKVSTGMYIYRITAGNYVATKKMLLLK